jgi:hypothetical protein
MSPSHVRLNATTAMRKARNASRVAQSRDALGGNPVSPAL